MMRKPLVAVATGVLLTAVAFAGSAPRSSKDTVSLGDFASRVAVALGYEVSDQAHAVKALRDRGVRLAADLNAPLTDGQVALMFADLGVNVVAPANPGTYVTPARAGGLAGAIGLQAMSTLVPEDVAPPTQCLSSADRGTCVNCCKDATGLTGKFCGKYCHANVPPPPSPEEPMP